MNYNVSLMEPFRGSRILCVINPIIGEIAPRFDSMLQSTQSVPERIRNFSTA
jgi:hypothetical protein